ncbi:MAG: tRNA (adenosine(37)-N6)-threonylcarbamoyltransferase complex dimerization subunit type 1 TsaB [Synechococcus sp.]
MASYILGLHTATPTLALGLFDLETFNTIQSRSWYLDRQMSSELHPCLGEFLPAERWSELVAVAVVVGPGSFTSCRMGVTVARTLGQALEVPVFGISALAAIAMTHLHNAFLQSRAGETRRESAPVVAVQADAKRGEWYGGIYQRQAHQLVPLQSDRLWTDSEWEETLAGLGLLETSQRVDAKEWEAHPPVEGVLLLAAESYRSGLRPSWQDILPFYGRKPPIHNG